MLPSVDAMAERAIRQQLLQDFSAFLARCTRGHAVLEAVAAAHALPSYLLGLMNTAYLSSGTDPVTEANLRANNPGSERSRFGAEHWTLLIERGFAILTAEGWALTPAGVSIVLEFHGAARDEVARRRAPERVMLGLLAELDPLARRIPSSPRIKAIRALWKDDGIVIVNLYRTVWELYLHRRSVADDDSYFSEWPTGSQLGAVAEAFTTLTQALS